MGCMVVACRVRLKLELGLAGWRRYNFDFNGVNKKLGSLMVSILAPMIHTTFMVIEF